MSTLFRRILPVLFLLVTAVVAFAAPGIARPHGDTADRPDEMSTATPPPFHPNLQVAFGPFHLGATRTELDKAAGATDPSTEPRVEYSAPDGEEVTVTYAGGRAAEIHIERPLNAQQKAMLSTSDGIRLGAPIDAVLPLYGEPEAKEAGTAPGYTLYAWRMQAGTSIVFQVFLGRIVAVDMLPPDAYPRGVTVGGGSGVSENDPIVIDAPTRESAVQSEFAWLSRIDCGASGFRFAFEKNVTVNGKPLEAIGVYCALDERVFFFDLGKVGKGS